MVRFYLNKLHKTKIKTPTLNFPLYKITICTSHKQHAVTRKGLSKNGSYYWHHCVVLMFQARGKVQGEMNVIT